MFGRLYGFLRVDKRVLKREEKSTNICIWGFNRDIVECKGLYLALLRCRLLGFNRDIVECKGSLVLMVSSTFSSFNRDIVECKVINRL